MIQLLVGWGNQQFDYSKYIDWSSLSIVESINIPTQCTFDMYPVDRGYQTPPQRAYIQVYSSDTDRTLFTGFIVSEPVRTYVAPKPGEPLDGLNTPGQWFKYSFTCTSDEYLLNIKAVPFIPAYVNRTQGQILKDLAEILCPGFFDTSNVMDGDIVPHFDYVPAQNWSSTAKSFADGIRYRYKVKDKTIWYVPYGDVPLGIKYDEVADNTRLFSPKDLQTSVLSVPVVNDVTIIGDIEAGNNRDDYFIGDGFTGNFQLAHQAFRGASTVLLQETWKNATLNTQNWFLQDQGQGSAGGPGNNFDFSAGALNIVTSGGHVGPFPFDLGESYISMQNGIEVAGGIDLEAGELTVNEFCEGIIGGVYTDTLYTSGSLVAGFRLHTPASGVVVGASGAAGVAIQPWFQGLNLTGGVNTSGINISGVQIVTKQNHTYVLQMLIAAPKYSRYTRLYRTLDGEEYGGGDIDCYGNITWVVQDYDIAAASGYYYQPIITKVTVSGVLLPSFATYCLANNQNLNLTIDNTLIALMPLGALFANEGPSGMYQPTGAILPMLPVGSGGYQGPVLPWTTTPLLAVGTTSGALRFPSGLGLGQYYIGVGSTIDVVINGHDFGVWTAGFDMLPVEAAGLLRDYLNSDTYFGDRYIAIVRYSTIVLYPSVGGIVFLDVEANTTGTAAVLVTPPEIPAATANIFNPPGVLQGIHQEVIGNGFSLEVAQITAGNESDTLAFYAQVLPAAGIPIRLQSWEAQAAVSRIQNPISITGEAFVVGDDGIRSAIVQDLNPLPRTSEDCDNAAQAFLLDREGVFYNGTYTCTSFTQAPYFRGQTSDAQYWPTCGRFLPINSPRRGIVAQRYLVVGLTMTVGSAPEEVITFKISFGADLYLEKVLKNFVDLQPPNVLSPTDKANPPLPRALADIQASYIPELANVQAILITDTAVTFKMIEQTTPYPIEIRTLDIHWGKGATYDYVGTVTGPQFTIQRTQFTNTWFMRLVQITNNNITFNIAASGIAVPRFVQDGNVVSISGAVFTATRYANPGPGQYTVNVSGFYQFNAADIGTKVNITYATQVVTSRRSKAIRVAYPQRPAPPTVQTINPGSFEDEGGSIQFTFSGDTRNIYGIEVRSNDDQVIIYQSPGLAYGNLLVSLSNTPYIALDPRKTTYLKAYFFNHQWSYSPPTIVVPEPYVPGKTITIYGPTTIDPSEGIEAVYIDTSAGGYPIQLPDLNKYKGDILFKKISIEDPPNTAALVPILGQTVEEEPYWTLTDPGDAIIITGTQPVQVGATS